MEFSGLLLVVLSFFWRILVRYLLLLIKFLVRLILLTDTLARPLLTIPSSLSLSTIMLGYYSVLFLFIYVYMFL